MKLLQLDRRWIYLTIALAVILPILFPLGLPIKPSPAVRRAFEAVEALPNGSRVLISFDYGPDTKVEMQPMAIAMLHQCFRKNVKVVAMALDPGGQANASKALRTVAPRYGKQEGVDYCNLGFKSGNEAVVVGLGLDFRGTFPADARGTPWGDVPMLKDVHGLSDFQLAASFSSGRPGAMDHVRLTHGAYGRPLLVGVTGVMAPEYYAYLNSGQIVGLLGGLRGAAEMELLVGERGTATAGLDAQSVAHFTIVFLIVLSNLAYFSSKRGQAR